MQNDAGTTSDRVAAIQAVWSAGCYALIGDLFAPAGAALAEDLARRVGLDGREVLDIATGTGATAIALARRSARVTGVDLTPALLGEARRRAEAEGLAVTFDQADFLELPYPADRFDIVTSTFGVMFADDPHRAARELSRVVRPGGAIATTAWSRDGWVGRLDEVVADRHPELAARPRPDIAAWCEAEPLRDWFSGTGVVLDDLSYHDVDIRFASLRAAWAFFEEHSGPIQVLRDSVTGQGGDWPATRDALTAAWEALARAEGDGIVLPLRYGRALLRRERTATDRRRA